MPKDIRDILKEAQANSKALKENHRQRFEQRLNQLHTPKKQGYFFLKVAASIIVLLSVGYYTLFTNVADIEDLPEDAKITNLSSISPEMKQIENYYLTAINYEMASIEQTPENKIILDNYLEKIAELTNQYKQLNIDLTEKEINEKTINALITNLQLRLQLLLELKDTIQEMKTPKTNRDESTII